MFSRIVPLARRQPDGEWWSSAYGGDTVRIWFFSTDRQPSFDRPTMLAAYQLDDNDPDPAHTSGWWLIIAGMRD